jgi:hypothetical protein
MLTDPSAEIAAVVSRTFNCCALATVVLRGFPFTVTSDDETNWLPPTTSTAPCCTWAKVIVVGDRELISGAGLALPQRGFRVLPQPRRDKRENKAAKSRPQMREDIEVLL